MDEISPLFAIQAEKALKSNNPQLAIEICKRGIQFFPDYQIGYVLLAEAYEMLGDNDQRDKTLHQIHQQFPKAITTRAIDEKIKVEGSLLQNNEDNLEFEINNIETDSIAATEDISETEDIAATEDISETEDISATEDISELNDMLELEDVSEFENSVDAVEIAELDSITEEVNSTEQNLEEVFDRDSLSNELSKTDELSHKSEELPDEIAIEDDTVDLKEEIAEELVNIDELIDEAQSVIEDMEETIEDLEDEIANSEEEFIEEIMTAETLSDHEEEEIIQEFAEMESEIADLQDFAKNNENPDSVVEFSEELLELENENIPFETNVEAYKDMDISKLDLNDNNLIPGINYLPFKFHYDEIIEISKNISVDSYLEFSEENQQVAQEKEEIQEIVENDLELLQENEAFEENNIEYEEEDHLPEDFIPTETLAMIYEKQGKYMNAIDIYQKLMEIHPEKMEHYLNKIMLLETEGN